YGQVRQRLEQIREGNELINSFWRTALRRHSSIPEQNEELEDLRAYAQHLQAMDLSPERPAAFTTEIVDRQQKRAIRVGLRDRGLLCEFRFCCGCSRLRFPMSLPGCRNFRPKRTTGCSGIRSTSNFFTSMR